MKMAQECTDQSSVVTSSLMPINWWDLHHHQSSNDFSSWHHHHQQQNPNSNNSSGEDQDVSNISPTSFTNASNHSGLTVEESSGRQLVHETVAASNELINAHEHASDSQLWRQVFMSVENNGELHNGHGVGENFLEALSSKSISSNGLFDHHQPAYDYLKKLDNNSNWEFTSNSSFNNFDKAQHHLNGSFNTDHPHPHHHNQNSLIPNESDRLSNLVSNWSIAPPDPEINHNQFDPKLDYSNLDHQHNQYSSQKQFFDPPLMNRNSAAARTLLHDLKMDSDRIELGYRRSFNNSINNGYHHQNGFNNSPMVGDNTKLLRGKFSDGMNFTSRFTKPLLEIHDHHVSKPCPKPVSLSDSKKPASSTRRGQGSANEGKKKRNEETSQTAAKKAKQESSTASSVKAPKVKLTDRITTLQQIVSPFGKTDTASVLYEAIQYIRFLQEQVQLFSNPYLKTNSHKDIWGNLERKEMGNYIKHDLRSRGLCLVPISCTPQAYRENNGSDFWTPAYRGCLYR
jgi:hypothetical protein